MGGVKEGRKIVANKSGIERGVFGEIHFFGLQGEVVLQIWNTFGV